ncbi:MAG: hypothetical protein AAF725_06155 [Acidobacteriota bacterium]
MSAFHITDWTDFVRGLVEPERQARMQGCLENDPEARRTVAALERVARLGAADAAAEIPEAALRAVYGLARSAAAETRRPSETVAALDLPAVIAAMPLVFDSALAPAPLGMRDLAAAGPATAHRQLFYELDNIAVELRHEPAGGSLVGQMIHVGAQPAPLGGVSVLALSSGRVVARCATSSLGEFQADELPARDLDLLFIFEDRCLEVTLPAASDR